MFEKVFVMLGMVGFAIVGNTAATTLFSALYLSIIIQEKK